MADPHLLLVDDDFDSRSPSGIYKVGEFRDELGAVVANDRGEISDDGVVFPLVRTPASIVPPALSEIPVSMQSFRSLLAELLASKQVELADPGAAEIDIPGSNIQIAVRLYAHEGKDYWEIWVKSPDGELQVGPDMEVRLQLLALSLSARTDPANEFLPMQLSVVSHQYVAQKDAKRNITHAYVKTIDGDVVPGSTSAEALAVMRLAHKYILRALSSGQLPKKLDQ